MKTSLVIPAYNEEVRLRPFLESISRYAESQPGLITEVILVDDGSRDGTVRTARLFENRLPLRVLVHKRNRGKGAAVQTGVLRAGGDYIIFMDADGATGIAELPKMVAALSQAQIAIGNRWMTGAVTERNSTLRRLAGWVYRQYLRLFGLGSIDTMCGFKGYRREVARNLFSDLTEERWLFDTEIAYRAVRAGYSIKNIPITWESKDGSKLDTKTLVKSAFQIWPLIQKLKRAERA
jgi:glycosyltransferase involved in cell wall biosynthesis